MNQLQVIEQNNQRVLTTSQLADSYGTDNKRIANNFNENKHRYKQEKHFFLLEGDDLKEFKSESRISGIAPNVNKLYLWTEKGAWLHAKSLNTDEAWDAYEMLVDDYYNVKGNQIDTTQLSPELQMFNGLYQSLAKQEMATKQLETKVDNISNIVSLNNIDWRKKTNAILRKIADKWSGVEPYRSVKNYAYEKFETRAACNLNVRLNNRKKNAASQGMTKSYVQKINKLDCIAEEKRFIEIYIQVVKEMAIQFRVDISDLKDVI